MHIHYYYYHFTAIIWVNLHYLAPSVKNCRIPLEQSLTTGMPLLMATSVFRLDRKRWSSHRPSPYHLSAHLLYRM